MAAKTEVWRAEEKLLLQDNTELARIAEDLSNENEAFPIRVLDYIERSRKVSAAHPEVTLKGIEELCRKRKFDGNSANSAAASSWAARRKESFLHLAREAGSAEMEEGDSAGRKRGHLFSGLSGISGGDSDGGGRKRSSINSAPTAANDLHDGF